MASAFFGCKNASIVLTETMQENVPVCVGESVPSSACSLVARVLPADNCSGGYGYKSPEKFLNVWMEYINWQ